ncbi:alpha/beta hydrolase [Dehalococcoidia bacterium]|nr:alpha/beta hydrolase [Dehalococcoidia bacterium]
MFDDYYIDLRGLSFHYRDWGGRGRPMVLLHGLASNCHIWDMVAPLIAERFSVVALDQRSHGQTAGTDKGYDFANIAADLKLFLETCGFTKPILVGHSWGGNVILELAATYPDLTSGLVFVDGGIIDIRSGSGATWEEMAQRMAPPDLTQFTMDELIWRAKKGRWGSMWRPEIESVLRGSFEEQTDGTIRPHLHRERHMQVVRALWDQETTELFPKVTAPVLILPTRQQGDERQRDWNRVPKEYLVEQAEARLPKSRTVWLEDSIHDVPLQRPEKIATVIKQMDDEGFFDQ